MDYKIRKADEKGRITLSAEPGHEYKVYQISENQFFVDFYSVPRVELYDGPTQAGLDYLRSFGLDVSTILRNTADENGYDEMQRFDDGEFKYAYGDRVTRRRKWPEGFSYENFIELSSVRKEEFPEAS